LRIRVALGADHRGFQLKGEIATRLHGAYEMLDVGASNHDAGDDYPDFAYAVAQTIVTGQAERGIIICGSGIGACIAANKVPGIRACLCHDTYSAHQGVEHDDMDVLCLGARIIGLELAMELVIAFLKASFNCEERNNRRLIKVLSIERQALCGGVTEKNGVNDDESSSK